LSYGHSSNRFVIAGRLCIDVCCEREANRYHESELESFAAELEVRDESIGHFLEATSLSDFISATAARSYGAPVAGAEGVATRGMIPLEASVWLKAGTTLVINSR
jgi:hypothetical protein